ncbi:MAG: LacI family DNA-binding transcriptional regulator [Sphaerochaeta sp.]|jgi:LacI family transcriptional regulator|uniref:LacI family DNA-binding transcriptional regulator n=1 Tax=Sphaerochaeta sp. TaxID=1972642 RepID=UPI000A942251|nr:LacI family DNA-binding transcriptional regulator [Sphaerochaeta sp.]MDX9825950.1 LacI family DNA-binding transcriptional regulator [Sphaerochaeta sp.]MEA4864573.1 LacI family DNA-binding transcriptional regulator [Sphaerochaeta sp.]HAP57282.1 LacI family transcriptional regulator [Sphaerochaeta sp.]HBO35785.1 LacI family transcriptional regulator [Sphaerochaeta sp.]
MKKVTIETVAQKVGVSAATVSYALSGKRKISQEVTEKILKAVEELDYRPSITARNLASKKTWSVGLYASPTQNIREDYFFNNILAGVLDVLHVRKYQIHLYADYLNENTKNHPDLNLTQPIDGALIMNPRINDVYINHIRQRNIPYVVIGTPNERDDSFYVDADITAGYYAIVNYLIKKGHRKIILVNGNVEYTQSEKRRTGYSMAFHDNGLNFSEDWIINVPMLEEQGYRAFLRTIKEIPDFTAVVTFNDTIAVGVLRALKESNLHVPSRVAVVSAGNTMITRIHSPAITSLDMGAYEIGSKAADLLIDVIERKRIQPSHEIIQTHLVERESS